MNNNNNDDTQVEDISWLKKRKLKKKAKKEKKKQKKWFYKVLHKENPKNKGLYYIELFLSFILTSLNSIFKFLLKTILILVVIGCICGGYIGYYKVLPIAKEYDEMAKELVDNSTRDTFKISETSTIYDCNKEVLAELYKDADLEYLEYDEIPKDVINAYVAIEDRTYWDNPGIDLKGIIRVCYNYVMTRGDEMHGASTITQQLARNIFLTHEVSIERKLKEIFISLELTKKYSKEDIIEFYVNDICYANGIYGIEGAAKAYFNKDVNDLTLSQIAYLCAIPNQPEYYNPYKDSTRAITRRDKILKDMYSMGYISEKDYKFAIIEEITIEKPKKEFNDYLTSYAIDCTVKYLMQENGFEFKYHFNSNEEKETYDNSYNEAYTLAKNQLYIQGYNIYTSLDPKIYEKLQNILDEELSFSEEKDETTGIYKLQGALTCIDNNTQKVIAVVGGRSQEKEQGVYSFNRAYQSYRQPGSSIKPLIVYTPALENGYTPDTIVQNIDVSKAKEKGVDVQSLTGTMMTLREAVEKSKNGVAWQVFDKITPSKGLSYIEKMKFSNICKDDYNDASALGGLTNGVTTVEMASAYSTLSNHGKYKEPTCLTSIIDRDGTEIYKDSKSIEIYDKVANDKMIDILKGVITRGTASKLNWYSSTDTEAFAKTGTTNGNKDGWLCGSTPYYSIAVWIGYDTPKEMSNLYGSTYPGQIWKKSMLELIKDKDVAKFELSEEELNMSNSDNYYSYLPGRDDEEVLSPGYTVGDFRTDRVIGESIDLIINQINSLDSTISNHGVTLENLYNQGVNIINTLRSTKYKAEMTSKLTEAYNSKKGIQETPNEDVPSQEDTNETIDSNVPQVEEPTTSESSTEVTPPTTETVVPETPSSSETINEPIEQPTETPSIEEPTIDDSLNTTTETQETSLE